jgi:hypothetical protein
MDVGYKRVDQLIYHGDSVNELEIGYERASQALVETTEEMMVAFTSHMHAIRDAVYSQPGATLTRLRTDVKLDHGLPVPTIDLKYDVVNAGIETRLRATLLGVEDREGKVFTAWRQEYATLSEVIEDYVRVALNKHVRVHRLTPITLDSQGVRILVMEGGEVLEASVPFSTARINGELFVSDWGLVDVLETDRIIDLDDRVLYRVVSDVYFLDLGLLANHALELAKNEYAKLVSAQLISQGKPFPFAAASEIPS